VAHAARGGFYPIFKEMVLAVYGPPWLAGHFVQDITHFSRFQFADSTIAEVLYVKCFDLVAVSDANVNCHGHCSDNSVCRMGFLFVNQCTRKKKLLYEGAGYAFTIKGMKLGQGI
jgi:hypothetical protein